MSKLIKRHTRQDSVFRSGFSSEYDGIILQQLKNNLNLLIPQDTLSTPNARRFQEGTLFSNRFTLSQKSKNDLGVLYLQNKRELDNLSPADFLSKLKEMAFQEGLLPVVNEVLASTIAVLLST